MPFGNALLPIALIASLGGCYGPVRDDSRITSTALVGTQAVALVYHQLRYRPAAGIAAFPDGGVPRYDRDRFIVALAEPAGKTSALARFGNPALPGAGSITVRWFPEDSRHLYLARYGQQTTALPLRSFNQQVRIDLAGGDRRIFDLRAEVARVGRSLGAEGFGEYTALDSDGTLLVGATDGERRELWVRAAGGALRRIAAFDRFDRIAGDDIIYSDNGPPFTTFAVNWRSGGARPILRYNRENNQQEWQARDDPAWRALNRPSSPEPTASVVVGDDGKSIRVELPGRASWSARVAF